MASEGTVLIHFDTDSAHAYRIQGGIPERFAEWAHAFKEDLETRGIEETASVLWEDLGEHIDTATSGSARLYATGIFQHLSPADTVALVNGFYVDSGLYFNIVDPELESFYSANGIPVDGSGGIMAGMLRQEFRSTVVCGSFQQSLGYIEDVIDRVRKSGALVLSPPSTKVKPATEGTDFILFDYQDHLKNSRDTWRHKYIHMDTFRRADAVIVCNPGGKVGQGTLFELGFMSALSKRVIFTEQPVDVSVLFPCEVGLNL